MAAPFYVYDLLANEQLARWGANNAVGSPVTITYSFPTSQPSSTSYPNFTPFTATEVAAAESALTYIGSLTKITFVETSAGNGQLQFGNGDVGAGFSGRATYNYTNAGIQQATVFMSNTGSGSLANSDFVPGSITSNDVGGHGWGTLLHEIGHALGFKHPFDQNDAGDPNSVLPSNLDDLVHTVMSYTAYQPSNVAIVTDTGGGGYSYTSSNLSPQTYSLYDIAALQYLYGTNTSSAGGKVFAFTPDAPVYQTIFDAGPNDTIDCSALTGPNVIDLTPGAMSDLAITQTLRSDINLPNRYDGSSALTIAYGCLIANVTGGSGSDQITGNSIANTLNGRGGADTMWGMGGNDVYAVDNAGDHCYETAGQGTDTIVATVSYGLEAGQSIETLQLSSATGSAALNISGNEIANTLRGNAGANVLTGGVGADLMYGNAGNDVYSVDNAGDHCYEGAGQGTDTVVALVSYALEAGQSIEALQLAGSTTTRALNLTGNELANTLRGNAGANTLNGRAGADLMYGNGGNDVFVVDQAGDHCYETAGQGTDTVVATVSYTLDTGQSIETLQLSSATGSSALNLTGNDLANTLRGNAGANVLDGRGGADILYGNGGADTFRFTASIESPAGAHDTIADFSHGQGDRIDLHLIDANTTAGAAGDQAFAFTAGNGTGAFTGHAGELRYEASGANTLVQGDTDGNGTADFAILLTGTVTLTTADFIL